MEEWWMDGGGMVEEWWRDGEGVVEKWWRSGGGMVKEWWRDGGGVVEVVDCRHDTFGVAWMILLIGKMCVCLSGCVCLCC